MIILLSATIGPKCMFCSNTRNVVCIEIRLFMCHKLLCQLIIHSLYVTYQQSTKIIDIVGKNSGKLNAINCCIIDLILNAALEITCSKNRNHSNYIYTPKGIAPALRCWPI